MIYFFNIFFNFSTMGIGDWGLGIGDWGVGGWPQTPTPKPKPQNPQPPTPHPQSPIPNPQFNNFFILSVIKYKKINKILNHIKIYLIFIHHFSTI
jgi:hypothetical protein